MAMCILGTYVRIPLIKNCIYIAYIDSEYLRCRAQVLLQLQLKLQLQNDNF
jgi:hypothetical protein